MYYWDFKHISTIQEHILLDVESLEESEQVLTTEIL